MNECLLLSLELPPVHGLLPFSATSFDTNLNSFNVLICTHDLIFFFISILLLRLDNLVPSINIFYFIWIVLKVFEFLLDLFIFLIVILAVIILLFLILFVILELLQQLDVFCCWVPIERRATIMNDVDLPQVVNEIVMMEGSMRVKDEVHHFWVRFIVPLGRLVNEPSTVNEDQASHLNLMTL